MGCGASKNDVIATPKNNLGPKSSEKSKGVENGSKPHNTESLNSTSSVRSEGSTIPASDYYQNNLNIDTGDLKPLEKPLLQPPLKPPRSVKTDSQAQETNKTEEVGSRMEPVAFVVPADDEKLDSESLIKRHPPRRLRKTIEEQSNETPPSLTEESLKEKVELANERRNQALYQRVASARQKSARVVNRVRDAPFLEDGNLNNEFRND